MDSAVTAAPVSVYRKIAAIYNEIRPLQKDAQNERFRYKYLSEATIKAEMLPLLAKHQLVFRFVRFSDIAQREVKTQSGTTTLTTATVHFEFACAETGQTLPVPFVIDCLEGQDKTYQKLLTNAQKYVFFGTFMLPTGDPRDDAEHTDNEQGEPEPKRRPAPASKPAPKKPEPTADSTQPVDAELQTLWGRMKDASSTSEVIESFRPLLGDDAYYTALNRFGMDNATQLAGRKMGDIKALVKYLLMQYRALNAQKEAA